MGDMIRADIRPCAVSFNNNGRINEEFLTLPRNRTRRAAGLKVLRGEYMLTATFCGGRH